MPKDARLTRTFLATRHYSPEDRQLVAADAIVRLGIAYADAVLPQILERERRTVEWLESAAERPLPRDTTSG